LLEIDGQGRSVSLESIRKEFRLSAERLDRLLSILVEREKVIQGPEGQLVHSLWLDEIVRRVRALGKKELSVRGNRLPGSKERTSRIGLEHPKKEQRPGRVSSTRAP
jgi:3-methyladenine DNA glycosylase Mpg